MKALDIQGTHNISLTFSSVQSLSRVQLFATSWIAARQASLSITNSQSLLKLMPIELVKPSSHLILCRSLTLGGNTYLAAFALTTHLRIVTFASTCSKVILTDFIFGNRRIILILFLPLSLSWTNVCWKMLIYLFLISTSCGLQTWV